MITLPPTVPGANSLLSDLNDGFLHQFVRVTLNDGTVVKGECVGAYNERVFMWSPEERDTISIVRIGSAEADMDTFTNEFDGFNSAFTLTSDDILEISVVDKPEGQVRIKVWPGQVSGTLSYLVTEPTLLKITSESLKKEIFL
jgi:hypothetical protein